METNNLFMQNVIKIRQAEKFLLKNPVFLNVFVRIV